MIAQNAKHLKHVRNLEIVAPFHKRLRRRCPDSDDEISNDEVDEDDGDQGSDQSDDEISDDEDEDDLDSDQSEEESEGGVTDEDVEDEEENSETSGIADRAHATILRELEDSIKPLLRCIPDNSLQNFRSVLPSCFSGSSF